jgi:hypothetical protein
VIKFNIHISLHNISYDGEKMNICSTSEYLRFLKGVFINKERFSSRFLISHIERFNKHYAAIPEGTENLSYMRETGDAFFSFLSTNFDDAKPFSYTEAFKLDNAQFRALVFSSINIPEMMKNLKTTRLKTDGINVKHKKFDKDGKFLHIEDYHNIYEVHEIDGTGLSLNESLYAVKCWCTSTNKEHWLWIGSEHKDDPLAAIASTFRIHKNLIPYIKELKRQGDILLVELTEDIKPEGDIVPLTKEQYFEKLTAQS